MYDKQAVDRVCAATTRWVVVIVSGRPLILDPSRLARINGLVEAWLPGSEGMGVADPLFGTTAYTGKCTWDEVFAATRAVGARSTVWGTDLGQRFNPPVEDGLALMADLFLEAGFSEEEVRVMAVENTRRLAGA